MNAATDGGESLSARSHVLIVDDADDTREMYAEFLNKVVGCRVSQLSTGTEVIATVTRDRPDVVVLDLVLPQIDGFDLCRQLRQTPGVEKTPIVVVTALQPLNPAQRSRLEIGHPDALLVKPCPPDKLLAELRAVVTRSRQLRAAAGVARGRSVQLREKSGNLMRAMEQQRRAAQRADQRSFEDLLNRVRGEYVEMPGLCLTVVQARVLLQLDESLCQAILDQLVQNGFLRRTPRGLYVLCH